MFPLVETIRYENGTFHNLNLHEERLNQSREELFPHSQYVKLDPATLLNSALECDTISPPLDSHCYKVRVLYADTITEVQWHSYTAKPINFLKVVCSNSIDYHLKSTDRSELNKLSEMSGDADSIIIVKNGMITDSAFANLIFFDGDQWITPNTPLLKGVMRESLLRDGVIIESSIAVDDLKLFTQVKLINAMLPFDQSPAIPIDSII